MGEGEVKPEANGGGTALEANEPVQCNGCTTRPYTARPPVARLWRPSSGSQALLCGLHRQRDLIGRGLVQRQPQETADRERIGARQAMPRSASRPSK